MSLFKNPNELTINPIVKMLIYGQPGSGKTTVALSAPSPVLFDFDDGVQRVNASFQCPTLQVQSWQEALDATEELKTTNEYKTVVIDTAGKMLDFMSNYICENDPKMRMRDGSLSLKGYGARKVMFCDFIFKISRMGKHVVFIAHEREDKDGDMRFVRPEMSGSSLGDLMKELDLVGYLQMIGNERTIFWNPTEKFYAKNTCSLPSAQKIPLILDKDGNVTSPNDFLKHVFSHYEENLKKTENMRSEYNKLISDITQHIESIDDVEKANDFVKEMNNIKNIWDSKLKARDLFSKKVTELNLTYNKTKKLYE